VPAIPGSVIPLSRNGATLFSIAGFLFGARELSVPHESKSHWKPLDLTHRYDKSLD
jgi:hypothetical protein